MAIADFLTGLENWFVTTEAQVLQIIAQIKADVVVAEGQINTALTWVAQNVPTIAGDINNVTALVQTVGLANAPAVATAIKDANLAVTALNAFAAASAAGQSNAQAVMQGYVAVKQAQAAVATAAAAAVTAPTK